MEGTQQAKEQAYLRLARELGRALGDSPELSQLCREAYQEYRRERPFFSALATSSG